MKNNIDVECYFGINRDNHTNESVFEIQCAKTGKRIIDVTFTPLELTQLLGRMGHVSGKADLIDEANFKHVGKTQVRDTLEVIVTGDYNSREAEAVSKAKELLLDSEFDWEVSSYFGSKDSFFSKDGEVYARVRITRYE